MSIFEAIILGLIQGATEFLPVSSSGHLVLVPAVFNMAPPSLNAVAIAHLGTLLAVLIYFFRDIVAIVQAVIRGLIARDPMGDVQSRVGWFIVVGSIPAAVAGLTLNDFFEEIFGHPTAAAIFLIGTAALLIIGEFRRTGVTPLEDMSWSDAIIIGLFQMVALLPGISRSGSTIVGGLLRGLNREVAARYSFLLGIPAILGAGLLSVLDLMGQPDLSSQLPALIVTFLTAAVSGYACIHILLQWVRTRTLGLFAIYCLTFGILYLAFTAFDFGRLFG